MQKQQTFKIHDMVIDEGSFDVKESIIKKQFINTFWNIPASYHTVFFTDECEKLHYLCKWKSAVHTLNWVLYFL